MVAAVLVFVLLWVCMVVVVAYGGGRGQVVVWSVEWVGWCVGFGWSFGLFVAVLEVLGCLWDGLLSIWLFSGCLFLGGFFLLCVVWLFFILVLRVVSVCVLGGVCVCVCGCVLGVFGVCFVRFFFRLVDLAFLNFGCCLFFFRFFVLCWV